jgi:thioredoxin-dependent peroxiredoxin
MSRSLVGQKAPEFELPGPDGKQVSLQDHLGDGPLVLFFVPHPQRGVCAKTACGLRNEFAEIEAEQAHVLGVTPRRPTVHAELQEQHRLPFDYLSDRDGKAHAAYGVKPMLGFVPPRATFLIDESGTVVWEERSPVAASKHVEGALRALRDLRQG